MNLLQKIKSTQPGWFTPENQKFFGDISYSAVTIGGKPYLIGETYGWSDMFGRPKIIQFYAKGVDPVTFVLDGLVQPEGGGSQFFPSREAVIEYLEFINAVSHGN